jgi:hypothetical protein
VEVLIVGDDARPPALVAALEGHEVSVRLPPETTLPGRGPDEVGRLADALLAFDRLLGDDAPDAVLLVSASDRALAAVLVATKARIPVVSLEEAALGDASGPSMNARLIAQLADAVVADDAAAIAASLRSLVAV